MEERGQEKRKEKEIVITGNRENCIKQTQLEFRLDIGFWEENKMNRGLCVTRFCMSSYAFIDNDVNFFSSYLLLFFVA